MFVSTGHSSIHVQIGSLTINSFFSNTPINVSMFSASDILVHQSAKNMACYNLLL